MSDDVLRRAVEHYIVPGHRQRALAILETYGEQPHDRELARVRFDMVALSRGDLPTLERLLDVARRDYRDVITRAESQRDPITGDVPRARLLTALGLEEDSPGAGHAELGH
jgi:hypothetical protein